MGFVMNKMTPLFNNHEHCRRNVSIPSPMRREPCYLTDTAASGSGHISFHGSPTDGLAQRDLTACNIWSLTSVQVPSWQLVPRDHLYDPLTLTCWSSTFSAVGFQPRLTIHPAATV